MMIKIRREFEVGVIMARGVRRAELIPEEEEVKVEHEQRF